MTKKIFLYIIILILIIPGLYFYSGKFVNVSSYFKKAEETITEQEILELDREAVMLFIFGNAFRFPPRKLTLDNTRQINRFWFVKDSYKEVYVEYQDSDQINRKILIEITGNPRRDEEVEDRELEMMNFIFIQCYEEPEGGGYPWGFKSPCQVPWPEIIAKYGLENVQKMRKALQRFMWHKDKRDRKAPIRTVYSIVAYFELGEDSWQIKEGEDKLIGKELDLYEYSCDWQAVGWIRK